MMLLTEKENLKIYIRPQNFLSGQNGLGQIQRHHAFQSYSNLQLCFTISNHSDLKSTPSFEFSPSQTCVSSTSVVLYLSPTLTVYLFTFLASVVTSWNTLKSKDLELGSQIRDNTCLSLWICVTSFSIIFSSPIHLPEKKWSFHFSLKAE